MRSLPKRFRSLHSGFDAAILESNQTVVLLLAFLPVVNVKFRLETRMVFCLWKSCSYDRMWVCEECLFGSYKLLLEAKNLAKKCTTGGMFYKSTISCTHQQQSCPFAAGHCLINITD